MNNLWDECESTLRKYFVYDKIFDLVLYDDKLDMLRSELVNLKRDNYEKNYKFIFLHYDTDYYLYPKIPGVLLTNLQNILVELDIPNYFCLIITNHDRLATELEYLRSTFTRDPVPISSIFCQLQKCHVSPSIDDIGHNINDIQFAYSCFNSTKRNHRSTLISLLKQNNLLEKGLVSYVS